MAWSSHNIDPDVFEFISQQEGTTSGSNYPQPALGHPEDTSTWDYLWGYAQPNHMNSNNTQHFVVNNSDNNVQMVPTSSPGSASHTTSTTPHVAPFVQKLPWQESPRSEVIDSGVKNDETPKVHDQGRDQE
ncbi:hypothetical protein N7453_000625 [Penicillium expansum]|nr:hypothetical protein N7453_000625 [Penicillium expansum]